MIKKFENFDFNEDWEEEDPEKGPFDDQLIYGEDGPNFKRGDRVVYIHRNYILNGKIGTVVNNITYLKKHNLIPKDEIYYIICFDKNINDKDGYRRYNIPDGHGSMIRYYGDNLRKLKD